jgi:hypothetical protein
MSEPKKLRLAFMLNGPSFVRWEYLVFEQLLASKKVEPVLCIVKRGQEEKRESSLFSKISNFKYKYFLWKLYQKLVGKVPMLREQPNFQLDDCCSVLEVEPLNHPKNRESFSEDDLARIKSYSPDIIVRFGFNILQGEILTLPTYGVWSYHHDNPEIIRGGPQGFWEVIFGMETTGLVLQKLNEKLDQGNILRSGTLKTVKHSYRGNLEQLMKAGVEWPAQVVEEIFSGSFKSVDSYPSPSLRGKFYSFPGNMEMVKFILLSVFRRIKFHLDDLIWAEKWNIGFVDGKSFEEIEIKSANWITELTRGNFMADPFPVPNKVHEYFVEHYNYKRGKGEIHRINERGDFLEKVISGDQHFSFPFAISINDHPYLIPEQAGSKRVTAIQELMPSNGITLLEDFEAVDPNLVFHVGKWWLFCSNETKGSNTHLYVFFAEQMKGPYRPHPQNPVKIDILGARPAGKIIEQDGKLLRPGQNCSREYGASVIWFEIIQLSETIYQEKKVAEIIPDASGKYRHGLHTMNRTEKGWVIDGKRFEFSFWHTFNKLKQKFR